MNSSYTAHMVPVDVCCVVVCIFIINLHNHHVLIIRNHLIKNLYVTYQLSSLCKTNLSWINFRYHLCVTQSFLGSTLTRWIPAEYLLNLSILIIIRTSNHCIWLCEKSLFWSSQISIANKNDCFTIVCEGCLLNRLIISFWYMYTLRY